MATAYERVRIARGAKRPTGMDYLQNVFHGFFELHGDRRYADDPAIVGGLAYLGATPVTVIAIEKGHTAKERIQRGFGAPQPEGYRKALRLMREAEKFHRPVVCFVDTSGAGCNVGAEERGQGEAIAECLTTMSALQTPVLSILIGEGEESLLETCQLHRRLRDEGVPRAQIVEQLASIAGNYVPSLYEVRHDEPCSPHGYTVPREGKDAPTVVYKRVVEDFGATNPLSQSCVPYAQLVHDRLSIEILRGCARGCRFCQAGMTYRPVRERSADQIVSSVIQGLEKTGYDEVSLTSLSTTDHSCIRDVLDRLNRRLEDTGIRVSIPSQRLDSFGVDMAESVAGEMKGGLTFAPEAGSQRMRDIINKNVTEEDLDRAAKAAFEAGWNRMKLYFMMGLPGERDEDIVAIANLADHVLELGRSVVPKARRGSISVSISVSVFIPKAATPFQWCPQLDYDDVKRRQKLLITSVRNRAVRVHYHDAETSLIEAALSRAGRDMTPVIIDAWRSGSRFDAWVEHFSLDNWKEAAAKNGIDLNELVHLPYELDWRLPWEHVSPGCTRGFLEREYRRSLEGVTTPDCTRTSCTGCGICPTLHAKNVLMGDRA